ncbi:MAG: protein kinase [archaeon]|nr:protein kinase [archaeon]
MKPENLVLDSEGYVKITDFGIAKIQEKNNAKETSGTPGYMAPEVLCALNHTTVVDYFALGVIAYEFMKGERPYLGKNRKEIKEKVLAKQVQVKKNNIEPGWSTDAADFINKTLQRKPFSRLGLRGAIEIKEHSWFKYYQWKELYQGKVKAPFIPKAADNFDSKYCNKKEKLGMETEERYSLLKKGGKILKAFLNFNNFNREENEMENQNSSYHKLKFKNPHEIYDKEESSNFNKGKSIEYGTTIFNRNMLSNKSTEDEPTEKIFSKIQSSKNLYKDSEESSKVYENHSVCSLGNKTMIAKGDRTMIKRKKLSDTNLNRSVMHRSSSTKHLMGHKY